VANYEAEQNQAGYRHYDLSAYTSFRRFHVLSSLGKIFKFTGRGIQQLALTSLNDLFTAPLGKPTFSCTLTGKGWMTKEAALANVRTTASSANPLFEKTEK